MKSHNNQPKIPITSKKTEVFVAPQVKWANSKAKKLIHNDIVNSIVPLDSKDDDGKSQ